MVLAIFGAVCIVLLVAFFVFFEPKDSNGPRPR